MANNNTVINAYNCYDELLGAFYFRRIDGHVVAGALYIYIDNIKHKTRTCSYLASEDYPIIEAIDPTMMGWFIPSRNLGDPAPAWLLEAVNGGHTLPMPDAALGIVRDRCTCGTSRSPSGGVHLDYCDNFAGKGCAGIVDASKNRCACCV
jgi:hypothetical protein